MLVAMAIAAGCSIWSPRIDEYVYCIRSMAQVVMRRYTFSVGKFVDPHILYAAYYKDPALESLIVCMLWLMDQCLPSCICCGITCPLSQSSPTHSLSPGTPQETQTQELQFILSL